MQYTFIYQALLEYYLYGDTELDVSSLENHLQTLHGTATHFDKIGLEEEFRVRAKAGSRPKESPLNHPPPLWPEPGTSRVALPPVMQREEFLGAFRAEQGPVWGSASCVGSHFPTFGKRPGSETGRCCGSAGALDRGAVPGLRELRGRVRVAAVTPCPP